MATAVPVFYGATGWLGARVAQGPWSLLWVMVPYVLFFLVVGALQAPSMLRHAAAAHLSRATQPSLNPGFIPLELAALRELAASVSLPWGVLQQALAGAEVRSRFNNGSGLVTVVTGVDRFPAQLFQPQRHIAIEIASLSRAAGATVWPSEEEDVVYVEIFAGDEDTRRLDWLTVDFEIAPSGTATPPPPASAPIVTRDISEEAFAHKLIQDLRR